jgi:hypothetical protein
MRRIAVLFALVLVALLPLPAHADGAPKLLAMVPLLPLTDGDHPDVDDLLSRFWHGYYREDSEFGFGPADVRVGRFDLDGDGDDELFVLIDKAKWRGTEGQPFVVATWRDHAWLPVGWGWADDDGIFVTDEVIDSWRTLDAGKFRMRWTADGYRRDPKQ